MKRMEWISVKDRLPEEGEYVLIYTGSFQVARIEKGISVAERELMDKGDIENPTEHGWNLSEGYFTVKRSEVYKACDEHLNNRVAFCWYANGGPMTWFGQDVTHWMKLEKPIQPQHGQADSGAFDP